MNPFFPPPIKTRATVHHNLRVVDWLVLPAMILLVFPPSMPSAGWAQGEDLQQTFGRAVELFEAAKYSPAEDLFKHISQQAPQAPEPYFYLGRICLQTHRATEGETWLKKATSLNPDFVDAWKALGQAETELGKFEDAKQVQIKILGFEPSNANAHFNLGVDLEQLHDDAGAIREFEDSIKLFPPSSPFQARARTNAGLIHLKLGKRYSDANKLPEAIKELEAAQQLLPPTSEIYSLLGNAYNQSKDPRAFEFLLKAGELSDSESSNMRSQTAGQNGRDDSSLQALTRKAHSQPQSAVTQIQLAGALWNKFEYRNALSHYEEVARLAPESARAQYLVGYINQMLGNSAAAKESVQRALDLDPHFAPGQFTMGELLAAEGNWPEASRFLTLVAQNPANDVSVRLSLGQMFLDHGNLDLAQTQLESAERIEPENKKVHYLLGRFYTASGQPALAAKQYDLFSRLEDAELEKVRRR
jgi:tetratricopeptide (TPR) repeat protein